MIAARLGRRVLARIDPSDVVQEALAAAAAAFPKYLQERPLPFVAWLRQFAWERLVKLHRFHIHIHRRSVVREENVRSELSDESILKLAGQVAANQTSPSQRLLRDELHREVRDALAQMTLADREILIMRNVEQMAMADVAVMLGITMGAAKVRHLRALRRLQALLEPSR
jgi:RNA polymerase sigma-70 factor, ECF subfamily